MGRLRRSQSATNLPRSNLNAPLSVKSRVDVLWRDGRQYPAEILASTQEVNKRHSMSNLTKIHTDSSALKYYVHYLGFNRRLDEWISADRIVNTGLSLNGHTEQPQKEEETKKQSLTERRESLLQRDPLTKLQNEIEKEHENATRLKNIDRIELGRYEIDTWYFSPYPEEIVKSRVLYICEFCLKYLTDRGALHRHARVCSFMSPPGKEIYRHGHLSVYEMDGHVDKIYCQNLCLLAKLFLDHKTLYYDVEPFHFYVLCERDKKLNRLVGYFSKEKHSLENYNVACILTLPPYQRKGYGRFLIEFSYALSVREGKVGSPEKPLSDLGLVSYRSYWSWTLLHLLKATKGAISIKELSQKTGIEPEDIISTLQVLGLVKYWKGQHVVVITPQILQEVYEHSPSLKREPLVRVHFPALTWQPVTDNDVKDHNKTNKRQRRS